MNKCIKCGSYVFNLYKEGVEQGGLCDVHYWRGRAHRAEAALAAPVQEPEKVGRITGDIKGMVLRQEVMLYTDNYLPIGTPVYTTPPAAQKPFVGLTDEEIWQSDAIMSANSGYGATFETLREVVRAIEASHNIKEKNT